MGRRQPATDESFHSLPRDATMLASPTKSAMPEGAHGGWPSFAVCAKVGTTEAGLHSLLFPANTFSCACASAAIAEQQPYALS